MKVICYYYKSDPKKLKDKITSKIKKISDIYFIEGANENDSSQSNLYEFDAYNDGIRQTQNNEENILFINDTVFAKYDQYLIKNLVQFADKYKTELPVIYGILDNNFFVYGDNFFSSEKNKHIRSNIFILNPSGKKLFQKIIIENRDIILNCPNNDKFREIITIFLKNDYHRKNFNISRKLITISTEYLVTKLFFKIGAVAPLNRNLKIRIKIKIINLLNRLFT